MSFGIKINKHVIIFLILFTIVQSMFGIEGVPDTTFIISGIGLIYGITHIRNMVKCDTKSKYLIISLVLIHLISILYCYFKYGQSFYDGIYGIHYIFISFLYFYFYNVFKIKEGIDIRVYELLIWLAVVVALLQIFQSFLYPNFNIFETVQMRNNKIRIFYKPMIIFSIFFIVSQLITYGKNVKKFFQLAILLFYIIYVYQGRGTILLLWACLLVVICRYYGLNKKKKRILVILLLMFIVIPLCIYLLKGKFGEFLFSFLNEIESGSGSGGTRINELGYYWELFLQDPLFGIGFLKGSSPLAKVIYANESRWFYMDDMGVFSTGLVCGIFGFVWISFAFFTLVWQNIVLKKINSKRSTSLRISNFMMIFMSVFGILCTDYMVSKAYIMFFCMFLSVTDAYITNQRKSN
ncbi:MAG: hypothetical protein K0R54_3841 [Clostridiaceae bacterium]|nr:hypothetical protein [Clostridiaceae bacterium]